MAAPGDVSVAAHQAPQYGTTSYPVQDEERAGGAPGSSYTAQEAHDGMDVVSPRTSGRLTPGRNSMGRSPMNPVLGRHTRTFSGGHVSGSGSIRETRTRTFSQIEDPDMHEYEEIEPTAYSGAMATIIKDLQRIFIGSKHPMERILRICFAVFVCIGLISIQLYVLATIKTFVTSPAVRGIRQVYGEYEEIMYHGHVKESEYGFSIGIGGPGGQYFDPTQFSKVSDSLKGNVCIIPFSQPAYLSMILFIWALSVIGELKVCLLVITWLHSIENQPVLGEKSIVQQGDVQVIVGMPVWLKAAMFLFVILPRMLCTLILFWLGCRWLAATLDFTEVLINSIALSFVIHLNELLYDQLVSDRSKRELADLRLDMKTQKGAAPSVPQFVGSMGWAFVAVAWIYVYLVHLQHVIPGYQWDVRGPCAPWVAERFNFWRL